MQRNDARIVVPKSYDDYERTYLSGQANLPPEWPEDRYVNVYLLKHRGKKKSGL